VQLIGICPMQKRVNNADLEDYLNITTYSQKSGIETAENELSENFRVSQLL